MGKGKTDDFGSFPERHISNTSVRQEIDQALAEQRSRARETHQVGFQAFSEEVCLNPIINVFNILSAQSNLLGYPHHSPIRNANMIISREQGSRGH